MAESITITDNRTGESLEIPIDNGGVDAAEWRKLRPGIWFHDPGLATTSGADSAITELDGENGILRYRGYPIEQLAQQSTFLEVSYLLIHGELPTQAQHDAIQSNTIKAPTSWAAEDKAAKYSDGKITPAEVSTCGANTISGRVSWIFATTSSIAAGRNGSCVPLPACRAFITSTAAAPDVASKICDHR